GVSTQISDVVATLVVSAGTLEAIGSKGNKRGWTTALLGDLCSISKGKSPTMKTPPGPYKFVVTAAERRTADSFQFDGPAVCVPVVSSTGHGHAAIHRIHFETGEFALANIMAGLVVNDNERLRAKFLYYYLWRYKEEKLVSLMAGTANTSLTLTDLQGVLVSFPSITEQDAIVAALDRMMMEVEQIRLKAESLTGVVTELVADSLHFLL